MPLSPISNTLRTSEKDPQTNKNLSFTSQAKNEQE